MARSRAALSVVGGDLGVQTLTLSLQTRPVTGTSLERTITGIRRWSNENRGADGTATENQDDVDADGNLVYPAEGSPSVNGARRRYTPDTPA